MLEEEEKIAIIKKFQREGIQGIKNMIAKEFQDGSNYQKALYDGPRKARDPSKSP